MLVSIVIRTYNRADLIARAVKSALSQNFQDFEIIVADDGSTDGTEKIVSQIASKDSRVKFFSQTHSGKPGKTLNLGLKNSQGKYIAMLDSDDEWLPSKLEKQVQLLESGNPDIGFVLCNTLAIKPNGEQEEKKLERTSNFLESILLKGYLYPSSMLAKKEIFDSIGPIDENCLIADDWDMFIRMAQKCNYDFVDEPLYKYYIHSSNISFSKNYSRRAFDLEYILNKHSDLYEQYPKILEYQYVTLASYIINFGDMKKARNYLKKSYKLDSSLKNWLRVTLSYFGKKAYRVYRISRGRVV